MTTAAVSGSEAAGLRTLEELNARKPAQELGQEQFLQILITQLANQNPLEPVSDTDFIAQMAQFSALEQMQALNSGFATSQAYALNGKYVYITEPTETGQSHTFFGKVDGVIKQDGVDYVIVGDGLYPADRVTGVIDDTAVEGASDSALLQSAALIGKSVSATVAGEDGEPRSVSGVVEKIVVRAGVLYAVVDGEDVPVSDIEEISL